MPQFSDADTTTVLVGSESGSIEQSFMITSFYMGHDSVEEIPGNVFRSIINNYKEHNLTRIMGGDANAHHTIWGSSDINRRGATLMEYLASTDMEILNRGNAPTFITKNRTEVLDISLCSRDFANKINHWHVSQDVTLSDHQEIRFNIETNHLSINKKFRNPRNTNWVKFNHVLQHSHGICTTRSQNISDKDELDATVDCLNKAVEEAYRTSCPESEWKAKDNNWWNNELSKLRKESRRLLRLYLARKDTPQGEACYEVLRRSRNKYTKEIAIAKKTADRKFFSKIEGAKMTSRLHKILSKDPQQGPGFLRLPDGGFTESPEETALLLLNTHFPGCTVDGRSGSMEEMDGETRPVTGADLYDGPVNGDTVEWSIFSFDPFKAPGIDGIYPAFIQKSWNITGSIISNIYKASVALSYVPKAWREVKVKFIPKPGKDDYTSAKAFRHKPFIFLIKRTRKNN